MLQPIEQPTYEQLIEPRTLAQTLAAADWTTMRLSDLGARPPENCRLRRARDLVVQLAGRPAKLRPGAAGRRLFAEAHRTLHEFWGATRAFNPRAGRLPQATREKLNLAYGGKDDPADDDERSARARNIQFELWLAAWFTAGEKPIRAREPDLEAAYRFEWRGVAAKRVRSRTQIRKRVQKAAEQVHRYSGTGFVAISLDNYSVSRAVRARSSLRAGERFFDAYPEVDAAADDLEKKAPWIRALICFGHQARWVNPKTPSLQMDNLTKIVILPQDAEDREYLLAYFDEQGRAYRKNWRR